MSDSPSKWVRRALRAVSSSSPLSIIRTPRRRRRHSSARPRSGNVGFVENGHDFWNDFVGCHDMQLLLDGVVNNQRHDDDDDDDDDTDGASSVARVLFQDDKEQTSNGGSDSHYYNIRNNNIDWSDHLTIACRLFHDLEREATSNTTALFVPRYLQVFERLIKVTYYQQNGAVEQFLQEEPNLFVLHSLVGLSTTTTTIPCILADMILTKYTHQLAQPDPFHHDHCLPLHMACANGSLWMLKLLHGYPPAAAAAVMMNRAGGGDFPLHIACRSKHWEWSTGIRELFEAAPDVLLLNTGGGGTSAFVEAALTRCNTTTNDDDDAEDDLASLETLLELLRHDPAVLLNYVQ